MKLMKSYRLIIFLLVMAGLMPSMVAQETEGPSNARIDSRIFDNETETWYVTVYDTVCDEYRNVDGNGIVIHTTSGTYNMHFLTVDGNYYDSIVELHLTVKYSTARLLPPVSSCDSFYWDLNNETYHTSQTVNYVLPDITNAVGCDSIVILPLSVNHNSSWHSSVERCGSYLWIVGINRIHCDTSGTYRHVRSNLAGCDSVMTLDVTIWHGDTLTDTQNVCDSYRWVGNTYTSSTTAQHHFANIHGCDSLVTLDLTVRHSTSQTFTENVCDEFRWMGNRYTSTGVYRDTIPNSVNCDSAMTLNLTVRRSTHDVSTIRDCDSYRWTNHGWSNTYTTTGDYTHDYTNAANCPSTDTLHLTIGYSNSATDLQTACDSYTWIDGHTYTASTDTPRVVLQNSDQCDSTVTLDLTVNYSTERRDTVIACYTYTWPVNGETYSTLGTRDLTEHTTNAVGCDSTMRLHLSVISFNTDTTRVETCNSYSWHGKTYTASTVDTDTLTNRFGCDSLDVLVLTIHTDQTGTDPHVVCDSYTWIDGITYTTSNNTAQHHLTTIHGCDSLVTLNLTINHSNSAIESVDACESYRWHGTTYTASTSTPTWHSTNAEGCDSVTTLHLTIHHADHSGTATATACDRYIWNGTQYSSTGVYSYHTQTVWGCDSTATLTLTIHRSNTGTDVQRACDSLRWHGTLYTASTNTPTFTETNAAGCDSVVTLRLTIDYSTAATDPYNVCDSLRWHGTLYTTSNSTATHHSTNAKGCDSVTTLNLVVRHSTVSVDTHSVCDRFTWIDGQTYTTDNHTALYDAGDNAAGCDSSVRLALTVRYSDRTTLPAVTRCDSYLWPTDGNTYTVSGTYRDTLTNRALCDSIVTLPLTIHYSFITTDIQQACDTYTWTTADADGSGMHTYGPFTSSATQTSVQRTVDGCDSTITLNLTIYHSDLTGSETFDVCDSMVWNGQPYTATGDYPYHTQTTHGCDSAATLHLTVRYSTFRNLSENLCDSYNWHGTAHTESGRITYTYPTPNAAGCDSTEVLNLVIRHSTSSVRNEDVCDSFRWDATGTLYTATAHPTATLTNAVGCDSNLTLHLTVRHSSESTTIAHGCDHYTWHGVSYSTDTLVDWHTLNAAGCDSTAHLNLTMDATLRVTDYVDSCQRCTWNGQIYYVNNTTATYTTQSAAGCDSITTLHLTIHHPGRYDATEVACDSFYWAGTWYTLSAYPRHVFTDRWGCDSTVDLNLTIHHRDDNTVVNLTECDSYTWPVNGQTYTGTAFGVRDTLQTSYGCDSIVTLNLTVNHSTTSDHTANVCDEYTWHGTKYTTTTEQTFVNRNGNAVGCDSTEYLHLTVRHSTTSSRSENVCDSFLWDATGLWYTATDRYRHTLSGANAVGCDSTLTLHLTVRHSTDTILTPNVCDRYTWHGTVYTASTTAPHFDTLNAAGCDSTARLHLTVRHSTAAIDSHDVCDAYTWHGTTYTSSTTSPTYHTLNAAGCDSTATLHLTVRYSTSRTDTADRCDRYTWTAGDGNTYTGTTTTPVWQVPGGNVAGCDSVAHLNLTIRRSTALDTTVIACDGYTFRGRYYNSSTVYPEVITNAVGCDSTITLYLTVDYTSVYNDVHDTCDSYTWTDGVTYTASTTTPVQHLYTVVGHCDSTSHLHLTIRHSSVGTDLQSSCDSFWWAKNGMVYYTSNHRDTVHLTNSEQCDSLLTLDLTVYHSDHITDSLNVCDSLVWHGTTYYANNNTARWENVNADGCDSIVTLNLNVRYSTVGIDWQDVCDSLRWLDGITYTTNNHTAQAIIPNQAGCDSLVTLNLNVRYNTSTPYTVTACDMYIWPRNNYAYNSSQTAYYPYTNGVNCPSVDTLYLTVNPSSHQVFTQTVCDTFTWDCHDSHMLLDSTGTYHHDYTNEYNCPSADTLHLSVNYNTSTAFVVDECDSYTWSNHGWDTTLTASCTLLHEYNTTAGCPSVDTLYLTIRYSSHLAFTEVACDSFHWDCHDHHQDYFTSGNYHHDYTNADGCPSSDTLHLTVHHNTSTAYTMTACDSYTWYNHGNTMGFDSTGTYINGYLTSDGCPSADTLHLTVNHNSNTAFHVDTCDTYTWSNHGASYTYTSSGIHTNSYNTADGCPSVDTLYLTLRYNSNTAFVETSCDTFEWRNNDSVLVFSAGGVYTNNYTNAVGCPSVDTLHLTIRHNSDSVYVVTACDQYLWPSDSITYTFSTVRDTTYINAVGCPSTDSLYLTIYNSTHTAYADTACDMYVWSLNHTAYNQTGTYLRPYMNADSVCRNVDTLHLVVYYNTNTLFVERACDTFRWMNHGLDSLYDSTGHYLNSYLTAEGCPSTDTLDLTVSYNTNTAFVADVCDSYLWSNHGHDTTLTATGVVLNDYLTAAGCPSTDTLYLTVRYNSDSMTDTSVCDTFTWVLYDTAIVYTAGGRFQHSYTNAVGCPSTDTLDLVVRYNSDSVYIVEACDQYLWPSDSITYTFSTVRDTTYINAVGCPSTDSLYLTIYNSTHTAYADTACDMYVWSLNHTAYNQSGTYLRPYLNADSVCRNVDTLHLVVYYNTNTLFVERACDTFRWMNHGLDSLYDSTGRYLNSYLTAEGCPSVDTLDLTVSYNTNTAFVADVCDSYLWSNHGHDTTLTATGIVLNDYLTGDGCPSTDTLYLTVRYNSDSRMDTVVCDSLAYRYNSSITITYRTSGTYVYPYTNDVGCPSVDSLVLTVNHNTSSHIYRQSCETYYWQRADITYTFSGTFDTAYLTPEGCPSRDTLTLTIDHPVDSTWYVTDCDSYVWPRNRTAYNTSGTKIYGPYMVPENVCENYDTLYLTLHYADHSGQDTLEACDSVVWHGVTYRAGGSYPFDTLTVHGCDSTVTLDLTIHTNSDTFYVVAFSCDHYLWDRDSLTITLDSTGLYFHRYINEWGCQSLDSLEVNIAYKSDTTYIDTACDRYTWQPIGDPDAWSETYTGDTVNIHSYINAQGCPSVDTLLLTLYISPRNTETIRACDSLLWRDGHVYFISTDLPTDTVPSNEWCDSIIGLDLTVNYSIVIDSVNYFCDSSNFIYHDSVIYTPGRYDYRGLTTEGCDSIVHLDLIQLPRPILSIEESHSCETYEYTLTVLVADSFGLAHTYSWYAEPGDLTLLGQESQETVVVHPVRNTAYSVTVDYDILPTCNNTYTTDTLVPIMQPHAAIQTTPPFVQANDISFRAEDKSTDYTSREWWVNGTYYSDEKTIEYSAPASQDDSVALMLVSISPTCTDTAYLLVPIHNFTVYVPNVFTPTEPSNQLFKVYAHSLGQFEMWVYTREGLLVYHTTDQHQGWDGRFHGELCQQAAYVYHIRYTYVVSPEAWHTATGTVTLLR